MAESLSPLDTPFFWALLAMAGWFFGLLVVGGRRAGRSTAFGALVVALAEVPRALLPLGFVDQPRFGSGSALPIVGFAVLISALMFATPVLRIRAFTKPDRVEPLRTTGLYGVVRHPLYLCDTLWPLGLSLITRSIVGTLLVVLWGLVAYAFATFEEEKLIEAYGSEYQEYRLRVRWKLIPYLV